MIQLLWKNILKKYTKIITIISLRQKGGGGGYRFLLYVLSFANIRKIINSKNV